MSRTKRGGRAWYLSGNSEAKRAGNKHGFTFRNDVQKGITHRIERQEGKKACDDGVKE